MTILTTVLITILCTFAALMAVAKYAVKVLVEKGWYASAFWSVKDQQWKVRGNYLAISQRIYRGIQHDARTGENTVKYIFD